MSQGCYISPVTSADPTLSSQLRELFDTLAAMDAAIVAAYQERGHNQVRSRYVLPLVRLAHRGPMTIRELAAEVGHTHSALSQTIAQMRTAGLVDSAAGADARTRVVTLTPEGLDLVPLAEAEWRATEAAITELNAELPYSLSQVGADLARALRDRSFGDRIAAHLPAAPGVSGPVP